MARATGSGPSWRSAGRASPYVPEVDGQRQRREGDDAALRAAIDHAVQEPSLRFAP